MNTVLQITLWCAIGGVAYTYLVYPIVIYVLARLLGREPQAEPLGDAALPTMSLLIAAHNEEDVIGDRLKNALAMDYPVSKLQIVVANDGSTDRTAEIVRTFGSRVTPLNFPVNRGKSATLNAAMPHLSGDIVLLSDANTAIDPAAARNLIRWFVNDDIGAVCGRLKIVDPANGSNLDSVYWRYETFLKRCENRLGALLGSNGALYAIRRELLRPIPENTIVDDFVIPLMAKIRSDCRIVYDAEAFGIEEAAPCLRDEFKRRVRIGAGGFQAIGMLWRLLSPRYGWTAFAFVSHKIIRWACPMLMLIAIASNVALSVNSTAYSGLLIAQVVFYAAAILAMLLPGRTPLPRLLRLSGMFVSINFALLVGFFRWLRGRQQGVWQRTQRIAEA